MLWEQATPRLGRTTQLEFFMRYADSELNKFVLCPKNGTNFSDANYVEGQSQKCYVRGLSMRALSSQKTREIESLWQE